MLTHPNNDWMQGTDLRNVGPTSALPRQTFWKAITQRRNLSLKCSHLSKQGLLRTWACSVIIVLHSLLWEHCSIVKRQSCSAICVVLLLTSSYVHCASLTELHWSLTNATQGIALHCNGSVVVNQSACNTVALALLRTGIVRTDSYVKSSWQREATSACWRSSYWFYAFKSLITGTIRMEGHSPTECTSRLNWLE